MTLKVFNTLTRSLGDFKEIEEGKVKIYLCGPTVYDVGHLGHARSAVAFDVIRKYFIYKGYDVTFVSNYTDIDDKMINRANAENISVKELAEKIIPEYVKDYGALGIMEADVHPKATETISEMVEMINILIEKKIAYVIDDGVYFDVSKQEGYCKLSGQKTESLQAGARIKVDKNKCNPNDFALWKFKKEGEPSWDAPFGEGRPGWHIECSAMSKKYLGQPFDIHGGGADLIFPHHEDEIAQSEACYDTQFCNYWLHNGFVKIDDEKMSKSLNNFFTIKEILAEYNPKVVRFFLVSTHYRAPINFSDTVLDQSKEGLKRIWDFVRLLDEISVIEGESADDVLSDAKKKFEESMNNDFETSGAIAAVFELINRINPLIAENKLSESDATHVRELLYEFDKVLGFIIPDDDLIPQEIWDLAHARVDARKNKDFELADKLRDEIKSKGYVVEDKKNGDIRVKKII